jgi:hypothetical protein
VTFASRFGYAAAAILLAAIVVAIFRAVAYL